MFSCAVMKGPPSGSTHTFTLNTHACFLHIGCGKHSKRNSLIAVRLGHPLRCLAVASCGSGAAKRLQKRFLFFFCPACKAAKVNNSSNPPHVLQLLIRGTTMDLLQRQHGAGFFFFNERLSKNNDSHFASIHSVARMRGTLKSDFVKQKTVHSQNKAGECRVHSGTAM